MQADMDISGSIHAKPGCRLSVPAWRPL